MRHLLIITLCLLAAAGSLTAQAPAARQPASFGLNDIKDYRALAAKLRTPSEPVSEYIAGRLSKETKMMLMKTEAAAEPSAQLRASLLYELNSLLRDQKLYGPDRFKSFKLPDSLLAQSAKPRFKGTAALARFNKQLIQIAYAAEFSRAPQTAEPAKADLPKPVVEDSAYTAADLKIAKGLAQRLAKPTDNLTKHIRDKLSKPTRDSLNKYDRASDPSPWLSAALAADLNRLLADPTLYDGKRFKDVALSDKSRQRIAGAKGLMGAELARLNKALLDEAYTTGLPPVAAPDKPKAQDTTQVRDLRPASSLAAAPAAGGDLSVGNLMLSAPDTVYTTHLWYEGHFSQKSVWRDSFGTSLTSGAYGDTVSGLVMENRLHYDRSWQGPSWGNYQIANLFHSLGTTNYSRYDYLSSAKVDTAVKANNLDWGLTLGAKRYLGNSPFFFFAENQDSQSLQTDLPDSDKQIDVYLSGGTGFGQVVDLANYVRARKFEQAMLREGIIARPLTRQVMGEMIRILQQRKSTQARIIEVNKMLGDRGLLVRTTYTYDTIFLLSEILDQSTDQLESGLEVRAFYRQQLMAQKSFDRRYLYGFGIGDAKYARPITLALTWVSRAHFMGLLYSKDTLLTGIQLYEYGAETGVRYAKSLSEMRASFEVLKPFMKSQLKYMLHAKYGYKILNRIELEALYDFTMEKDEEFGYDYAGNRFKYFVRDAIKRSEINLRLKYYFF